jgi:hypothetical protein
MSLGWPCATNPAPRRREAVIEAAKAIIDNIAS